MTFALLDAEHPRRLSTEAFIRSTYVRCHGAVIHAFPDTLAALLDDTGAPVCAAGVRFGLTECFSEQYLELPIEVALREATGMSIARDHVLEVTTLAGSQRAHPFRLVDEIINTGRSVGIRWGIFTATDKLRGALKRRGITLVELMPARRDRIAAADRWGRYYETDPWVCAVADPLLTGDPSSCSIGIKQVALHG